MNIDEWLVIQRDAMTGSHHAGLLLSRANTQLSELEQFILTVVKPIFFVIACSVSTLTPEQCLLFDMARHNGVFLSCASRPLCELRNKWLYRIYTLMLLVQKGDKQGEIT